MEKRVYLPSPQSNDLIEDKKPLPVKSKPKIKKRKKLWEYKPRNIIIRKDIYAYEDPSVLTPRQQILWHKKHNPEFVTENDVFPIYQREKHVKKVKPVQKCEETASVVNVDNRIEEEKTNVMSWDEPIEEIEQITDSDIEENPHDISLENNWLPYVEQTENKVFIEEELNVENITCTVNECSKLYDDGLVKITLKSYIDELENHHCMYVKLIKMEIQKLKNFSNFNVKYLRFSVDLLGDIKRLECCRL